MLMVVVVVVVVVVVLKVWVVVVLVVVTVIVAAVGSSSSAPGDALEHQHGARDLYLQDEVEQLDHGAVARGGRTQPKLGVGFAR